MRVKDLFVYPVKGLPGCRVESAVLDSTGFRGDRRYMLTDESGRFISQREYPELSQLQVSGSGATISVAYGGSSFLLTEPSLDRDPVLVNIWSDSVLAMDCGDESAQFFSSFLSRTVRLVYMHQPDSRPTGGADRFPGQPVSFADACPVLVVNTASLDVLNEMTGTEISALRFRPNIVVESDTPWNEDRWNEIVIGQSILDFVKTCGRCQVVNIDPATGLSEKEPLKTLSEIRRDGNRVLFGSYYKSRHNGIAIKEGDEVIVRE